VPPLGSSQHFMEPEGSLPSLQELSTDPFRNEFVFYGEGLLAPRPTPKLEDHPLVVCPRLLIQYIRS
jgi:hypothetical protein